jgi:sigma-B regulation protein RsbU (phosphoserine phosphatase)
VGAIDGVRYVATDFRLAPGERLVLHSDGVTDCVDVNGRPFGQDGLERALATTAGLDINECMRTVSRALDDWRGKAAHDDDVSLLILEPGVTA